MFDFKVRSHHSCRFDKRGKKIFAKQHVMKKHSSNAHLAENVSLEASFDDPFKPTSKHASQLETGIDNPMARQNRKSGELGV